MVSPILVALDRSSLGEAERLARSLVAEVGGFKVGLELLMAEGPEAVSRIVALELPVLVDAKLHDIPNTTRRAASLLAGRGARWVTVHAGGGSATVEAAVAGTSEGSPGECGAIAVTVLTSLDQVGLLQLGVSGSVPEQAERLTLLGRRAGAEGVVCSPAEVASVRTVAGDMLVITPGIRPAGAEEHDQKRVGTPEAAVAAGADLIVVGRAITDAPDPVQAAADINRSLAGQ